MENTLTPDRLVGVIEELLRAGPDAIAAEFGRHDGKVVILLNNESHIIGYLTTSIAPGNVLAQVRPNIPKDYDAEAWYNDNIGYLRIHKSKQPI